MRAEKIQRESEADLRVFHWFYNDLGGHESEFLDRESVYESERESGDENGRRAVQINHQACGAWGDLRLFFRYFQ